MMAYKEFFRSSMKIDIVLISNFNYIHLNLKISPILGWEILFSISFQPINTILICQSGTLLIERFTQMFFLYLNWWSLSNIVRHFLNSKHQSFFSPLPPCRASETLGSEKFVVIVTMNMLLFCCFCYEHFLWGFTFPCLKLSKNQRHQLSRLM